MTPIIPSLSPLFDFLLPRNIPGTDFGTGYGGTVCGFHTRPNYYLHLPIKCMAKIGIVVLCETIFYVE